MPKKLIEKTIKLLPKNANKALTDFTKQFFAQAPKEDLDMMSPPVMAKTAQEHFAMAKDRKKGKSVIRLETPTLQEQREGDYQGTIINIVNDDLVFLIDSVAAAITRHSYTIRLLIHPLLNDGIDSHIHIELKDAIHGEQLAQLENEFHQIIEDVLYATNDWQLMKAKLKESQASLNKAAKFIDQEELEEYISFLEYLYKDNFTLLGYREYSFAQKSGKLSSHTTTDTSLGLLHDEKRPAYLSSNKEGLPEALQQLRQSLPPLSIAKVNQRSTVHRSVPLDAVAVKRYNDKGEVIGEALFIGLFTSVTYSRSVEDIPYIRHKVRQVLKLSDQKNNSHDFRALKHILEKYPRDEIFQIEAEELYEVSKSIMRLQERQRIALFTRRDPFGRYISCLVYVPRDRFDTKMRLKIQNILSEDLDGRCTNFHTTLDDSPLARVLYYISIKQTEKPQDFDFDTIEQKLEEAGRAWSEVLTDFVYEKYTLETTALQLTNRYENAFPVGYQDDYLASKAIHDVIRIEQSLSEQKIALELYHTSYMKKNELRLKVFNPGIAFTLSEMLPILRNAGFIVISESPYKISPAGIEQDYWIHDFRLQNEENKTQSNFDLDKNKTQYQEALSKVLEGTAENDVLNKLVFSANMSWKEIAILRGYTRYLRQANLPYSLTYIMRAVTENPHIAREFIDLFNALFDPDAQKDTKANKYKASIEKHLENVASLDQDRILRAILTTINATLRTNAFQSTAEGLDKDYISYKINSAQIEFLPNPKPYREIFVYSPKVEGVHLRGGPVARGGLRWSDRHEDFRTEVLGLMKAQIVKNSVIVPNGSKGGFVMKRPPTEGGRDAWLAEGINCYKIFIRGLLDITDNIKGPKIIPPTNVVRLDSDDPYLVVAADKGTATFSDIANSLSEDYGFWLGDAFASGGSAGYDHKKMGITASGAWESVKRHFRELNHDTQTQPFDVIGVGDMGGDVFGNGMLLSEHIRLIGAFNHLHIVCDPDPDIKKTYAERKRLFDEVQGWDHYNTKLLSKGGRIYNRSEKSLELTEEIKKRFCIDKSKVTPNELMTAMLKARTDLLWFGGIGTYIKSADETHLDVGDKANDSIRIDATQLKASVLGEGANLGITHQARIDYARSGGKVNADFIDNSGGVDSSDHEVNIKILFTDIMSNDAHKITIKKRNTILEKMTEEVAAHVLNNNYQQSQAISLMELQAADNLQEHSDYITHLERTRDLDRQLESLPDQEAIDSLITEGKGLSRPEISTLQAYAKIELTEQLLETDIPDQDSTQQMLMEYFPAPLRSKYDKEIKRHRLHRDIVATVLAGSLINRLGPTFIQKTKEKTDASLVDIARAYFVVRSAFKVPEILHAIEGMDNKIPAHTQLKAMREVASMVEHATTWFLTRLGRPVNFEADIKTFRDGVGELRSMLPDVIGENDRADLENRFFNWSSNGLPEDLARIVATMPILSSACDIINITLHNKTTVKEAAITYFHIGEHFQLNWLRSQASFIKPSSHWASEALSGLINQLYSCQAGIAIHILTCTKTSKLDCLQDWLKSNAHKTKQTEELLNSMRNSVSVELPMLVIAEQHLRNLYRG